MFEKYQDKVLEAYKTKIESKQMLQLVGISPALLRNECLNIYRERKVDEKDIPSLRVFFGPDTNNKGYLKIIDEYPTGRFRSLSNFFKGIPVKPDRKNIELLAWLIDYKPRPYQALRGYDISSDGTADATSNEIVVKQKQFPEVEPIDIKEGEDDCQKEPAKEDALEVRGVQKGIPKKYYKSIFAFGAAAAVAMGAFVFYPKNYQCMYWAGDHYVEIACDQKASAQVIALDTFKISNLKKIDKWDTLTAASIGKVHYAKVKVDSVDFYTAGGDHPTNSTKRLLPLTQYILTKYVANKK